ncbi:MAG: YraN family protein [Anaerolineae bacterium]
MRRGAVGRLGEDLATDLILREGYELVERNWRDRSGEIDIVARDGDFWVFVEVKARSGHWLTLPEDGLTDEKARRLRQLALNYLAAHDLTDATWRIDLVAIELDDQNRVVRADLFPSAALL